MATAPHSLASATRPASQLRFADQSPALATPPDPSQPGRAVPARTITLFHHARSAPQLEQRRSEGGLLAKKKSLFPFVKHPSDALSHPVKSDPLGEFAGMKRIETVVRPPVADRFTSPSFRLVPYGDAWYSDVLVIYTNALRKETKTLFFILYCLHERAETLELGDIKSFFVWFEDYHLFFHAVVDVLQEVYLPWVERIADLPASRPRLYFEEKASSLKRTVRKTAEHREHILAFEPEKAARKLRNVFTRFAPRMLDYISSLEDSTAMIVECQYTIEDCIVVSKQMVAAMAQKDNYRKNIVLLLRWLDKRQQTAALWRREYMDTRSFLSYGRWKQAGAQEDCLAYFKGKCRAVPNDAL